MGIYLAASYGRKQEIAGYAEQLRQAGVEVDAPWLLPDAERTGGEFNTKVDEAMDTIPVDEGRVFAQADWDAIKRSDVLVAFTETPYSGVSRGGRHVELGLALAWNKKVLAVGPVENVFVSLPQIYHFWEWGSDVISEIKKLIYTAEGDLHHDIKIVLSNTESYEHLSEMQRAEAEVYS